MVQKNLQPNVLANTALQTVCAIPGLTKAFVKPGMTQTICIAVLPLVEGLNRLNNSIVRQYNGRKLDGLGFRYGRLMRVLVWVLEDTLSILQRYEAFSRDINLGQKTSHTV